jgi:hypothetical protein
MSGDVSKLTIKSPDSRKIFDRSYFKFSAYSGDSNERSTNIITGRLLFVKPRWWAHMKARLVVIKLCSFKGLCPELESFAAGRA